MKDYKLLTSYKLGKSELKNRVVMSPMTRSRAIGNVPNDLMVEYFEGARILSPSAVKPAGQMWTDSKQMQDFPVPEAMTPKDILQAKMEYAEAARNSVKAGFDGVELHSANGYLPEQFLQWVAP